MSGNVPESCGEAECMFNFKQEHLRLDFAKGFLKAEETFRDKAASLQQGGLGM